METYMQNKFSPSASNEQDRKIRIFISESERAAEKERIRRVRIKTLTIEEKILINMPSLGVNQK